MISQSRFCEHLVALNNLLGQGFEEWVFHPGMLFRSLEQWWGKGGNRSRPHEGVDVCLYRDQNGKIKRLDKGMKIPVLYRGCIVNVIDDYVGKTAFVLHDIHDKKCNQLYTIYGHIELSDSMGAGRMISEGGIIGTVSDGRKNKGVSISPHVHLSVAWIPEDFPHKKLGWDIINDPTIVTLLNPLDFIGVAPHKSFS